MNPLCIKILGAEKTGADLVSMTVTNAAPHKYEIVDARVFMQTHKCEIVDARVFMQSIEGAKAAAAAGSTDSSASSIDDTLLAVPPETLAHCRYVVRYIVRYVVRYIAGVLCIVMCIL